MPERPREGKACHAWAKLGRGIDHQSLGERSRSRKRRNGWQIYNDMAAPDDRRMAGRIGDDGTRQPQKRIEQSALIITVMFSASGGRRAPV